MSEYNQFSITNDGLDIIAEAEQGKTLIFTRIALGDGQLTNNDETIVSFKALKHECLSVPVVQIAKNAKNPGQVTITAHISNESVDTGFFVREIGVMAKIGDGEEKLYAYAYGGNYVDYMPNKTSPININRLDITTVVGPSANVTALLDKSAYATHSELDEAISTHNMNDGAHPALSARVAKLEDMMALISASLNELKAFVDILARNIGVSSVSQKVVISADEPKDGTIWIKPEKAEDVHTTSSDNFIAENDGTELKNPEARILQDDGTIIMLKKNTGSSGGSSSGGNPGLPTSETVTEDDIESVFTD